jgi:hypothetical protein
MVKKGTILGPRNPVTQQGKPRRPPGPPPKKIEDIRTERLVMRMHPDLLEQLSMLARERGVSRSAYIERVLLGWVNSDPRNPRLDGIGRRVEGVPTPHELFKGNPVRFGERWSKFSELSMSLLGERAQEQWLHDFEDQAIPAVAPLPPIGEGDDE